ncbi:MAG: alkyl hydroperoxide reductase [Chloroflexota bacterium]
MSCSSSLDRYRVWFRAAAVYNLAWGAFVVIAPRTPLEWVGVAPPEPIALWQAVGAMVLAFAPAYWWASRDPWAHHHIVLIGMLGKVMGLAGFAYAAATDQLPLSFGIVTLFNEVLWLPAFGLFLIDVARVSGWRRLLSGA